MGADRQQPVGAFFIARLKAYHPGAMVARGNGGVADDNRMPRARQAWQWTAWLRGIAVSGLLCALAACEPLAEPAPGDAAGVPPRVVVGSFSIRNPEIRQEMLVEFDSNGIRYWINADGSIGYFLEDGKQIDKIGNLVIAEYITRN